MTREEAARILDPETSAEVLREYGDGNAQIAACDEACRIAADVLRGKPELTDHFSEAKKMAPLTMEQLRKMDGQPVWIERNESPHDGKWFIVDHADIENSDRTLYTKEGVTYSDYGVHFTAYAYPPAHIDRDDGKDRNVRTNADWIRAMSDQELAAFLSGAARRRNKSGA